MLEFTLPSFLNEGIDFNEETKEVSYNPYHQDVVDTSEITNPTSWKILNVEVFSIFKRRKGRQYLNGNPLVYAMKKEHGWHFKSRIDEAQVYEQFDKIIKKFAKANPIGLTIVLPSTNVLNRSIAERIKSLCSDCEIITDVFRKLYVHEVEDDLYEDLYDEDNEGLFWNQTKSMSSSEQKRLMDKIDKCLDKMKEENNNVFSFHGLPKDVREIIKRSITINEPLFNFVAERINGRDILIIDDVVSRGKTLENAIEEIQRVFLPQSIKVLTLFSKAK